MSLNEAENDCTREDGLEYTQEGLSVFTIYATINLSTGRTTFTIT